MTDLFRPLDPEFRRDPYPVYARMRREAPVHPVSLAGHRLWVVTRYRDVAAVLDDADHRVRPLGLECPPLLAGTTAGRLWAGLMVNSDPPDHLRLRKLAAKALTPRAVTELEPRIHEIVDGLISSIEKRGGGDLVEDFAFRLPLGVITEMLGVPADDARLFREWTPGFFRVFLPESSTPDELRECERSSQSYWDYFERLIDERKRRPGEDLLSRLIAAEDGGDRLARHELVATALSLLTGGFDTTMSLVSNGLWMLLTHPSDLARLQRDPAAVEPAIEEFLRLEPPVQSTQRILAHPVTLSGVEIPEGEQAWLVLASATRDPDAFFDAERIDVARAPNPHLAFGGGRHFCIGAHLGRLEGRIAIRAATLRLPTMRPLVESIEYRPNFLFRVPESVPVSLH